MFSVSFKQPLFEINHDTSILIIYLFIFIYFINRNHAVANDKHQVKGKHMQ